MRTFLAGLAGSLLLALPTLGQTQPPTKTTYMQIFYEGSSWLAGREVLHYSPAFQGKTGELVQEDSTKAASPGALLFSGSPKVVSGTNRVHTSPADAERSTFVREAGGKMRLQPEADLRQAQAQSDARLNRGLNLVAARATLGRTVLTKALNAAAADGWEVVQLAAWGNQGGLVYLLRRR